MEAVSDGAFASLNSETGQGICKIVFLFSGSVSTSSDAFTYGVARQQPSRHHDAHCFLSETNHDPHFRQILHWTSREREREDAKSHQLYQAGMHHHRRITRRGWDPWQRGGGGKDWPTPSSCRAPVASRLAIDNAVLRSLPRPHT
jgi:hypothetical protein